MRSITQLTMEELTQELLTRPNTDRANLAERLLDSLNNEVNSEVLHLWSIEANRRLTEFENGTVKGIPGDEALALALKFCVEESNPSTRFHPCKSLDNFNGVI